LVPTTPLPIRRPKQIRFIQTPSHLGVVFLGSPSYKVTFANREFLNGQKGNETTRMDTAACPHIEGACPKENTRGTDRQGAKAFRGCDPTKSI
jgi:hypothetical protein